MYYKGGDEKSSNTCDILYTWTIFEEFDTWNTVQVLSLEEENNQQVLGSLP